MTAAEQRARGEAQVGIADNKSSTPFITQAHQAELRARLAHHRANPGEASICISAAIRGIEVSRGTTTHFSV